MVILAKGLNLEHLPGHHHQIIQNPQPILWNFANTYPVLTPVSLQFWLLGKMSENDDINSYKIYLDNNSNAQYIVVAQDSEVITSLCPHLFLNKRIFHVHDWIEIVKRRNTAFVLILMCSDIE